MSKLRYLSCGGATGIGRHVCGLQAGRSRKTIEQVRAHNLSKEVLIVWSKLLAARLIPECIPRLFARVVLPTCRGPSKVTAGNWFKRCLTVASI